MRTRRSGEEVTDEYIEHALCQIESNSTDEMIPLSTLEEMNDKLERIQLQLNEIYSITSSQKIAS
jgi:hypothetical protein